MGAGTKELQIFSTIFLGYRTGLEVEQPGQKLALIWNAGPVAVSLSCEATMSIPIPTVVTALIHHEEGTLMSPTNLKYPAHYFFLDFQLHFAMYIEDDIQILAPFSRWRRHHPSPGMIMRLCLCLHIATINFAELIIMTYWVGTVTEHAQIQVLLLAKMQCFNYWRMASVYETNHFSVLDELIFTSFNHGPYSFYHGPTI